MQGVDPTTADDQITYRSLSPDLWPDLELLFGDRGAREGCWCMRWRLPKEVFEVSKGDANRKAMKQGILKGVVQGVIAYVDQVPAAWCSVGPRADFIGLQTSDLLAPVDGQEVWSITCFFVHRNFRRQDLLAGLIRAALDHAIGCGARIVEAYPVVPIQPKLPVAFAWTGLESTFLKAGFKEVARRMPIRPIMRYYA